jgi:glycerophosphoryl diester phosphodiesterase
MPWPCSTPSMRKIVVIAHRGFHRDFPENTLESFKAAQEIGVDGIEFDVQETADCEFVVHHDDNIGGRSISSLSHAEIAAYYIGGVYRIPVLQEALEAVGRGLVLLVELKKVRSLEKFLAILRRYVDEAWTVLVSFDADLIEKLALLAPGFPRGLIREPVGVGFTAAVAGTAGFIQVPAGTVTANLVKEAHERGDLVFVWDGWEEDVLRRALRCGIDIIMTDRPDVAIREVRRL